MARGKGGGAKREEKKTAGMWRLLSAQESAGDSGLLTTLNNYAGRQVWVWREGEGTEEERAEVERRVAAPFASRTRRWHPPWHCAVLNSMMNVVAKGTPASRQRR